MLLCLNHICSFSSRVLVATVRGGGRGRWPALGIFGVTFGAPPTRDSEAYPEPLGEGGSCTTLPAAFPLPPRFDSWWEAWELRTSGALNVSHWWLAPPPWAARSAPSCRAHTPLRAPERLPCAWEGTFHAPPPSGVCRPWATQLYAPPLATVRMGSWTR